MSSTTTADPRIIIGRATGCPVIVGDHQVMARVRMRGTYVLLSVDVGGETESRNFTYEAIAGAIQENKVIYW